MNFRNYDFDVAMILAVGCLVLMLGAFAFEHWLNNDAHLTAFMRFEGQHPVLR